MQDLAATLRSARLARGFTQEQLARLVDSNHSLISRYEHGLVPPDTVLVRLARVLKLNVSIEATSSTQTVPREELAPAGV